LAGEESLPPRKPRADAERNRQRLLEVARASLAEQGAGASLEDIARSAGVGIGTLYRHFPTRDALIAEVYRHAIGQLAEAADRLAAERAPLDALREWMMLFVDYLTTKKLMGDALRALSGGTAELYASSGSQLEASIGLLTRNAVEAGEIRLDIIPLDLLRAIAAVSNDSAGGDWEGAARRMVEILIAGLRYR
jgi:AcrR family transcriptional regulator